MPDILQLYSREKLHSVPGGTLAGADLSGADLRYADLRGHDLRGAVLRNACLHGANLSGADLSGADLTDADIFLAHFQGADLRGANFQGTRLAMAQFSKARVDLTTNGLSLDAAPRLGLVVAIGADTLETAPPSLLVTAKPELKVEATPIPPETLTAPALSLTPAQTETVVAVTPEPVRQPDRWADHGRMLQRATVRKDGKKVAYLATLTTARISAAVVALAVCGYTLAPPSLLASLRLHESPTWVYAAAYYLLLALGSYVLVPPLRDRWYGDSGLPY
ncbi:MAG: pentapeptide repeat-containing protein [Actinomycetota bacterium]